MNISICVGTKLSCVCADSDANTTKGAVAQDEPGAVGECTVCTR